MRNPFRKETKRQADAMRAWRASIEKLEDTTETLKSYNQERAAVLNGVESGTVIELRHPISERQTYQELLHVVIGDVVEKPANFYDQDIESEV